MDLLKFKMLSMKGWAVNLKCLWVLYEVNELIQF